MNLKKNPTELQVLSVLLCISGYLCVAQLEPFRTVEVPKDGMVESMGGFLSVQ